MPKANKPVKKWTNAYLMQEFLRLDKKFFSGKLPIPLSLRFCPIDGLGYTFRYRTVGKRRSNNDRFGIQISPKLRFSKKLWYSTLVHEMVHLEQRLKYSCYGKRFDDRMKELAAAGIFKGIW
jgi:hypothetical protein